MNVVRRFARSALAALVIGALAACSSGAGPAGPNPPHDFRTTLSLDPGEPAPGAQLQATVGYTLPASAEPLGAYLVEVHFDPARLSFVASDPAMASGRVVNALQAASGSIVIAGAQAGGFTDGLLFKGVFLARAADVKPADLSVALRELADTRLREILE